jgi:predicted HAD superfamily hydrolase
MATLPAELPGATKSSKPTLHFDALLEFAKENRKHNRRHYTEAADLYASFMALLPEAEVVSFDIFDTALVRLVDHPVDVFFHLESMPAFAQFSFARAVSRLRVEAEDRARHLVYGILGTAEVNLLEIYQVFCDLNGISREFAPDFMAAEEEVELRLCVALPAIQQIYMAAAAAGKRVIFVSDMYHTHQFLLRLLHNIGYPVLERDLFLSSVARKAKQSGQLFPEVIDTLGVPPQAILHFGDHPISDYERAKDAGIVAILHSHKASADQPRLVHSAAGLLRAGEDTRLAQQSHLRGMVRLTPHAAERRGRGGDFWWNLGYSAAGPMTVGFCQWLQQTLQSEGLEHAYFMLRDGHLFYETYKVLFADDPNACPASTLESSRRAMLVPVIGIAPDFAIPSLLAGIGPRPVREFLERLGIDANRFAPEARIAGFSSLDEEVDATVEITRLLKFIVQKPILQALLDRGKIERETMLVYLEEQQVTRRAKVAVVDLGWSGTIQKSLHLLLAKDAPAVKLTGFYLATFSEAIHSIVPGVQVRSWLAHRGEPANTKNQIGAFLNLFEMVYTSTGRSLLYFEKARRGSAGNITAVRQAPDKSEEQVAQLDAIHAGTLAFAEDFKRLHTGRDLPALSPAIAAEEFFRVINQPTAEEALLLSPLVHCDNLGSTSIHVAAELRPTSDPAQLLDDYKKAAWKQGILALPTAEAASLRTLLTLMEAHS